LRDFGGLKTSTLTTAVSVLIRKKQTAMRVNYSLIAEFNAGMNVQQELHG
jgi:hypothetical protein